MSPEATSQRQMVAIPSSYASDGEVRTKNNRFQHRRPQKLFTTQRLPAFFAWLLLLTTSFAYWICILPEILVLLPNLIPIPIVHCVLFVLVCANFILATFMDPVNRSVSVFRIVFICFNFRESISNHENMNIKMLVPILDHLDTEKMTMMMITMNRNLELFVLKIVRFFLLLIK